LEICIKDKSGKLAVGKGVQITIDLEVVSVKITTILNIRSGSYKRMRCMLRPGYGKYQ
jgi:hypothetical protein